MTNAYAATKKIVIGLMAGLLLGCNQGDSQPSPTSVATETAPPAAASAAVDGANWERYGRTYKEDHFSPLAQIHEGNINRLGLAWYQDLPTGSSVGASAPLAVDGVLYYAVGFSVIHATDAKTGKLLWQYDPKAFEAAGTELRSGWGVRGIAYGDGKVFTGTIDGRLIAIDAATGTLVWSAQTTEPGDSRYITGMPYVMDGKVIIGHGGADFAPVRGYVTAYDMNTGEQAWRFYTVPGNPADGFENDAMAMAAKTWTGEWWKYGGGATAWHAMAYDPEFNRIYIGTGNGAPWNQKIRSPGGGDNLFVCSILALDADTGEYVWHYQVNPGETWDYNANMDIQLAELAIAGETRKVILHAPKNGFFYVIDRSDGKLISAEPFAEVSWAERIDLETGRPVEIPAARFPDGTVHVLYPDMFGAHGVEAMSYNPGTGLVYLPARNKASPYTDPEDLESWEYVGKNFMNNSMGKAPADVEIPPDNGWLAAWDPVKQQEVWRVEMDNIHNGGTLTTAGNLVVQGRSTGELSIYAADSGEKIWSFDAQNGIQAQPISYLVDGKQYISLLVGWRGSSYSGEGKRWDYHTQKRRLLTFALDGQAQLPAYQETTSPIIDVPDFDVDETKAAAGKVLFNRTCSICHGGNAKAGGAAPDLLRSAVPTNLDLLVAVVQQGSLKSRGMPRYEELSTAEVENLQHYIRKTARESLDTEQ